MSGRIWPGALCEIVRSAAGNEGRRVVAVKPDHSWIACCYVTMGFGQSWECIAVDPLMCTYTDRSAAFPENRSRVVMPAAWLRPILPPPSTDATQTDDTAPCEVERAQPDRVSA